MDKIAKGDQYMLQFKQDQKLKNAQKTYFDCNNRFLVSYGTSIVNLIPLQQLEGKKEQEIPRENCFIIDQQYETILDVQLVSNSFEEYRLDVACKVRGLKNVIIFDINHSDDIDMRRQFTFSNVDTSRMQVKISRDFTKVVLANKDENYLLFWD